MENNELTTREKLKAYFETGKYPTQSQFAELIDSLKFKEDVLTNKEVAILANSLESIDNGYVLYIGGNIGDLKLPIVVSSRDEEDQVITIGDTYSVNEKRYFLGSALYTIKAKNISGEELQETEYYLLTYQINPNFTINKFFGNNLHTIPDGFEFGTLEGKRFVVQIVKQNLGRKINVVNTSIKFVNKTEVPIEYRTEGASWGDRYRAEDTVTDHYDIGDYLYMWYRADLREVNKSIECKVYNEENGDLLMTGYLNAGQNYQDSWGGDTIREIRHVKIECNYYENID